jgi:hypothetical protein
MEAPEFHHCIGPGIANFSGVQLKIRAGTFSFHPGPRGFSAGLPDPAISGKAGESEFSVCRRK